MSDVEPVYDDEPGGRSEYVTGLIAGALIGLAAGAIFTGMAARRQPCPCEHEGLDVPDEGPTYAALDVTPVPATAAVPHANGNGQQAAPGKVVVLDDTPLPAPTATKGPASPSRAPFPGVMRPGSPVAGPWAARNDDN